MSVNGVGAANRLLSFRSITPGLCLYYVWLAYAFVGASTKLHAQTALECWQKSLGKHPGDYNPPAGVPVFFGAKPSSSAGDITISVGGGRVAVTSTRANVTSTGIMTIRDRAAQIGRPYLGWAECIFDQRIAFSRPAVASVKKHPATIRLGSRGSAVKTLQKRLLSLGYVHLGKADSIFGHNTDDALRAFQRRAGLVPDGICGPRTWSALGY